MNPSYLADETRREHLVTCARGKTPADLLIKNVRLVNVLSGEIHRTDVAVSGDVFLGFGDCRAENTLDAGGRYMCPGLIDGHIHIESSFLSPPEFARVTAQHGTCAVVGGPHEIANVLGTAGLEYMLEASADLPVTLYFMMPSCVPASHLETSGAELTAEIIADFLQKYPDRFLGLGEMMNFPGVLNNDPDVSAKISAAGGRLIDGHAPLLTGRDLCAYALAGPSSDHESVGPVEAREKLRAGLFLMLREGTTEKNMAALLPVVNEFNAAQTCFVSDDRSAADLKYKGHMDHSIRKAVRLGMPPIRAVQMASVNTARRYGLTRRGAIAPGFRADFILLDDLESFSISSVHLAGRPIDACNFSSESIVPPEGTTHLPPLSAETFRIPLGKGRVKVIGTSPGQLVTQCLLMEPKTAGADAIADPDRDMVKLAVIERHKNTGNIGLGFINGLEIKRGALATTVAHDAHNLIIAGVDDRDMAAAGEEIRRMGGGMTVVLDQRVLASLPLPIAGLMSDEPLDAVVKEYGALLQAAQAAGTSLESPFAALSFMALSVIPSLKLTDLGPVDVDAFHVVSLWENE